MQEVRQPEMPPGEPFRHRRRPYRVHQGIGLGVLLVLIGVLALATATGALGAWVWALFWPLVLIALGLLILARRLG